MSGERDYRETKERWGAFWDLEDVGRPMWVVPTPPNIAFVEMRLVSMLDTLADPVLQLRSQLDFIRLREQLDWGDDFVPYLQVLQGVSNYASAFGCEVRTFEHTRPWAFPVIGHDDPPEKVSDLAAPAVTDGGLGDDLRTMELFVAETGGEVPVAIAELQGPLDTAYLVWESTAFMTAMYEHPEEVHHLMGLVTDLVVDHVKAQRAIVPELVPVHFPPVYMPWGAGISMSDDCLALLSPPLYERFALPYVNRLSEEFGGVFVHSCGNFVHQLDNLEKVHGLRGINFGVSETPFEAVWERFGGRTAVVPHLGLNKDVTFADDAAYVRHVLDVAGTHRGLCVLAGLPATDLTHPAEMPSGEQIMADVDAARRLILGEAA